MSLRSWSRRRLSLLALLSAAPLAAQESASLNDIAQILMLEDRREFDAGYFQRASQHADPRVRERAAMALGRIGDPAATTLLMRLLMDQDSVVRIEAVFALGELGDRGALPELTSLASQFSAIETSVFSLELVTAIAKIGGPDAERALMRVLERHPPSDPPDDRATTSVLLEAWRFPRTSALAARLPGYIRSARGDWRRNAVYSATRLQLAAAATTLLDVLQDDDQLTRQWAARGLTAAIADSAQVSRETFTSVLRTLVNDRDAQVRINALRALGTFADSGLAPLAIQRLNDRDPGVAAEAATALGRLRGSRARQALMDRFPAAPAMGLRRIMAASLARIDPAEAIEQVRTWRNDADWRVRSGYVEVLNAARTPAAGQHLAEMLDDNDPRIVSQALGALAQFPPEAGDSTALVRARTLLTAPDLYLRATAIGIVGRTRSAANMRDLLAAYRLSESDAESDARLAAVDALAELAATPEGQALGDAIFLTAFNRSDDYLVRRAVQRRFGAAPYRRTWGTVGPIETGRTLEEYRDVARRYVLRDGTSGRVTIDTERGSIQLQLFSYQAPLTVENFLRLVDRRYFDNGRWHRVVPNFVIQDGDPRGDGSGGPGRVIRDEINRQRYGRGTLGMALSGPDTGGSQFFITHSPQPHLDGGYTVFGDVVAGWDVVDQLVQGDRIRRIYR